jgi:hypothetical protein
MPGAFTHFAVVKSLRIHKLLVAIDGMTEEIALSLLEAYSYTDLGAVSPDLPYLAPLSASSAEWGNLLHHSRTVETVRTGVRLLPNLTPGTLEHKRAMAWLFGYAAHVVADMVSHPVVTRKVGPYEKNKARHRVCELNQDVYVFQKYFQDEVRNCEYLKRGVKTCTKDGQPGRKLAPFLNDFWWTILRDVYPDEKTPIPRRWFGQFVELIDRFAEEGRHFVSILRGYLEDKGLVYPSAPDLTYVNELTSPYGTGITMDDLFARFQAETKAVWGQLAQAVTQGKPEMIVLPDGDLDTGISLVDNKTSVFWS